MYVYTLSLGNLVRVPALTLFEILDISTVKECLFLFIERNSQNPPLYKGADGRGWFEFKGGFRFFPQKGGVGKIEGIALKQGGYHLSSYN